MKTTSLLALAASLPQLISAHYVFDSLIANGVTTGRWDFVRELGLTTSNGPMSDVTDPELRCNKGSFANAGKTKTMPVKAGDTVGFNVNSVLGHPGPLFVYMSKSTTASVSTYEGEGDWFKIYEVGVNTFATYDSAMSWASDGWKKFDFKIPAGIEDGEYLLRAEHIAIHGAGTLGGSQFYMSCAQIEVSGGTGAKPSPVGTFPGIYSQTDPGILFEPYWPLVVNYTMPGLKVYPSGGSYPDFTANPSLPAASAPLPETAGGAPPVATAVPAPAVSSAPVAAPAVSSAPVSAPAVSSAPAAAPPTSTASIASQVSKAAASISAAPVIRFVSSSTAVISTPSALPSGKNCRLKLKRSERLMQAKKAALL